MQWMVCQIFRILSTYHNERDGNHMKKQTKHIRRCILTCCAALFLFTALPLTASASGEPGTPGDISLDGRINAKDYALLKRFVLGTYSLDAAQRLCADLNKDGSIDAKDYLILKRVVLGQYQLPQTGTNDGNEPQAPSDGQSGTIGNGGQTAQTGSEAQEILRLVNRQRAQNGLAALTLSDKLCELASRKAEDMAANNYFDHTSPTYGTPFDMLRQFGVSYRSAGENIAAGQRTPEEVMNGWMNSPGHRANILSANYTELGVGVAAGPKGLYWVQLFLMP